MAAPSIPVLLVEDSPVAVLILKRILASSTDIEVVGVARDGIEALELIPTLQPKVICTDLHMPRMGGLELTRNIMAKFPCPILVISASVDQQENAETVFQLLQAGALDVFPKPTVELFSEYEQIQRDLIIRIKILAGVSVFTQHSAPHTRLRSNSSVVSIASPGSEVSQPAETKPAEINLPRIVAIGASTGGPQALYTILKSLPADFPVPILCVQHISQGFLPGLVNWLAAECSLRVVIAQAGDLPQPGIVYFSPDHCHLKLDAQGRIALSNELSVAGHRPSVTVLFQAAAAHYRRSTLGVLLTGMGRDGAEGLRSIAQAGGMTIAQDEQSCVVFGMPREAIALGAAQHILPLNQIAPLLLRYCVPRR